MKAIPNVFTALVLGIAAMNYFAPFGDLDWAWQIRTGEIVFHERTVTVNDRFSYTIAGSAIDDFEWLYEVVLYLVWKTFGIGGLKLLRVILVLTPVWIVLRRLSREGTPWHGQMLVFLTCLFVLAPSWNLRPLYVTTIGLLLVSGWLHEHCTGGRPLPWYLPGVMLVWANSHPGVIAGQGLLAGAIGWEWINRFVRLNSPLDRDRLLRLSLLAGLGLLATLISPDPAGKLIYAFKPELAHPIQKSFIEMQPTWRSALTPPFNLAPIYLVAFLVLATVVFRFRQYRLWELSYLAVLTLLGNFAARGAMDWFLNLLALGVPHMVILWRDALREPRRVRRWMILDNRVKRLFNAPLFRCQWMWPAIGLGGLTIVSLIPPLAREMPIQNSDEWPVAAMDALERDGVSGNFFGSPDHGTYVGWRLKDRGRCYVDTRGFYFPPILVEDSLLIPRLAPGWRTRIDRVLNEFPTDYFILETNGPRSQLWTALKPHIPSPTYIDDQCAIVSAPHVRAALPNIAQ